MCVSEEVTEHLSGVRFWETAWGGVGSYLMSLVNPYVEREKDDQG